MTEMTEMNDLEFEHLAFNEALYLPSFGDYVGPGVVKRTLNYLCFANSKTAFRFMRKDKKFGDPREHTPVSVRLSYHPNEAVERADALVRFYARGDAGALAAWRDGEVSGGGGGARIPAGASCADSAALRDLPPAAPRGGGLARAREALQAPPGLVLGGRDALYLRPRRGAVHALGGRRVGVHPDKRASREGYFKRGGYYVKRGHVKRRRDRRPRGVRALGLRAVRGRGPRADVRAGRRGRAVRRVRQRAMSGRGHGRGESRERRRARPSMRDFSERLFRFFFF